MDYNPYFITILDYHGYQVTINICFISRFRKIRTNENTYFVAIEMNNSDDTSCTNVTVDQYERIIKLLSSWSQHRRAY